MTLSRIIRYSRIALIPMILLAAQTVLASSGGTTHGEAAGSGGWAVTDTYRVMNFAVLAIALFFILRKPVAQFLGNRIKSIQEQMEELELKKAEAEKLMAEYNEKLSSLSAEAEKIIAQYRKQGEEAKKKILAEAQNAAVKLEEQARRTIDHEFKEAKRQLEEEILEQAIAKAEARLKQNITDQDQEMLVGEYLNKVVIK